MKRALTPQSQTYRAWLPLVAAAALCSAGPAAAFEPPDVHQVEDRPQAYLNQSVTATGRFESYGAGLLRLVGSKIEFRFSRPWPRVRPGITQLEVTGRLVQDARGLRCEAKAFNPLESEVARFAQRRKAIQPPNYEGLYELSRWARQRARWYDDRELQKLATGSYREAFAWEEQVAAEVHDIDHLLDLANRGETLGLELSEVERIRHRTLWIGIERLTPGDAPGRLQLAQRVRDLLPGTEIVRQADSDPLVVRYFADPNACYADLDEPQRRLVHRAIWARLVAEALEIEDAMAQANPAELGRRAEQLLPERADLVRRFDIEALERRVAPPKKLSRTEMLDARDAFQRLDLGDRARELLNRWLADRRADLPPTDAEERLALSRDYVELVGDRPAAAALLREVVTIVPGMPEAESSLRELGYVKVGGLWKSPAEADQESTAPDAKVAIRPGDAEQAVVANFRKPDRASRVMGAGWMIEQWIYDGPPALYIYLRRSTATGEATVLRVFAP